MPDNTAPPTNILFAPMAFAIIMQITPIVAAVPNAVPVSIDTRQQSKNVMRIKASGIINFVE